MAQVLTITRRPQTMDWKIAVAAKVNEIRQKQMFRTYAELMQEVLFSLVEINVAWLGIYVAMMAQFIAEMETLDEVVA